MRKFHWFTALAGLVTLALAGCGGSGCDTSFGATCSSGGGSTLTSISVITSLPQIPSDGSRAADITALVRDVNNNVVADANVSFASTSGALTVVNAKTDANGTAKATLSAGTDPNNRTVTVTVGSGTATATIAITVTGTALTLSGPANLVQGNSGSYDVLLTNSSGQGIQGAAVTVTSAKSNALTPPTLTTDGGGRATFTLAASVGGQDTVTAAALGLQQQKTVDVSTQNFSISAPATSTKVNLGASQNVTATWLNNGVPVANTLVTFAATRGTLVPNTPVMTDASGNATVSISATSAGPSIVSASATGVTAQVTIDFVATVPSQIAVQAGPSSVAVGGISTISATVRDVANNLVEGAAVDFQIQADPTNGALSTPTAVTNSQGIAQTVYTAGGTSSGANGVQINATVHLTAITSNTFLTVGGQTVFLSLGTGNTIDVGQGAAVYQITYTVFAVDSGGAALANVPVTLKVLPVAYGKGSMFFPCSQSWTPNYTTVPGDTYAYSGLPPMCRNEDTDYTGNINSSVGKDYNGNTKLDPGNIAVVAPSSGVTDARGRVDVTVTYPRDHAYWVKVSLVASTRVAGTESSATSTFVLQGAADDYKCSVGPPGPTSPYGIAATCSDPN
jgi:Bacterial Ig-like domain (group 1)